MKSWLFWPSYDITSLSLSQLFASIYMNPTHFIMYSYIYFSFCQVPFFIVFGWDGLYLFSGPFHRCWSISTKLLCILSRWLEARGWLIFYNKTSYSGFFFSFFWSFVEWGWRPKYLPLVVAATTFLCVHNNIISHVEVKQLIRLITYSTFSLASSALFPFSPFFLLMCVLL